LPNVYPSTFYVLELSWPDQDGKGLHSPLKNQTASILFDNHPVWNKKTTDLSDFGDYYGAQHESIKTTIVVTQSSTHTLTFNLPPRTAWDLSKIELKAYALPSKIQGIGYSPYRDCQYPGGTIQPSPQDIQEDLTKLFHTSNAIRTYSSTGVNSQVVALANSSGLPIFVGAWLDKNANDGAEIQGLINLAQSYPLDGVIVGNEYYLRHRTEADIEYLRQKIVQVKNTIPSSIPVTTAEIDDLMFNWSTGTPTINPVYRPILDQVDIVMVHIYPFWSGMPIEGAAAFTIAHYKAIQTLIEQEYPGQHKRVVIGEAGWPSAGGPQTQAIPSLQNQRRYLLEFLTLAEQQGVEYFYFDGFDELWKIEEPGHVGQNWGYSYSDRSAKHVFYGTLLPSEQLVYYNTYPPLSKSSETFTVPGSVPSTELIKYDSPRQHPQNRLSTTSMITQPKRIFSVYTEWPEEPGHFVPSGWMGDAEVPGRLSFNGCYRDNPYNGNMSIRIDYQYSSIGWAGIYWVNPVNNWGDIPGGISLTGVNRLTFWARTDTPGAQVKFIIGGVGYKVDYAGNALCNQPNGSYPDSVCPKIEQVETLNTTWTKYVIDLSTSSRDLSRVVGGFGWVTTNPLIFYLDDIVYEFDQYSFADVSASHWAANWIERLYAAGITGGCIASPLQYCPEASVTRAQMAIFLLKGIHGSSYTPPAVGASTGFTDVATGYWAAAWIKQLAAEGITGGCGTGIYCPDATVTRAQMAIFLLRAKHGSSYSPPDATGVFTDVPVGYWADEWIEQLAVEGITGGCGVGIYCPDADVTRAQMAVFLVKTFNLP